MKVITVGRSKECNVVVNDEKASRVHLQLVQDDNGNVSVVDLGSTNGTWVNDKRIVGEMRLNQGDRIRVGNTLLQLQLILELGKCPPTPTKMLPRLTEANRPSQIVL